MTILPEPLEFEWDSGNIEKNFAKHRITNKQIEEAFTVKNSYIMEDVRHSLMEQRYMLWSRLIMDGYITVIFTIRSSRIRVISARPMNKKERKVYEKAKNI